MNLNKFQSIAEKKEKKRKKSQKNEPEEDSSEGGDSIARSKSEASILFLTPQKDRKKVSRNEIFGYKSHLGWAEMCGQRADQEDAIVIVPAFLENPKNILLCCFDGISFYHS